MPEDFTSLVGTVSTRSAAPPEMPALYASPLEVGGKQRNERLDITRDRRIERVLDSLSFTHAHLASQGPPGRSSTLPSSRQLRAQRSSLRSASLRHQRAVSPP